jgi:hypothetical protein
MKINITPNPDQIRFYARSAMHAWDFQGLEAGRAQVIADMAALLRYLDACDGGDGVVVVGIAKIERGVRLEVSRRHNQIVDLTDEYAGARNIADHSGDLQIPVRGDIENVRPHGDGGTSDPEVNLAALPERHVQR